MAFTCPRCGAINYPALNSRGCELCGYTGVTTFMAAGVTTPNNLKGYCTCPVNAPVTTDGMCMDCERPIRKPV
jgi:hypothetical protein